jgi:hypothetical protein
MQITSLSTILSGLSIGQEDKLLPGNSVRHIHPCIAAVVAKDIRNAYKM